jgi:hypothetical protein
LNKLALEKPPGDSNLGVLNIIHLAFNLLASKAASSARVNCSNFVILFLVFDKVLFLTREMEFLVPHCLHLESYLFDFVVAFQALEHTLHRPRS